jgi:hypothetical protein
MKKRIDNFALIIGAMKCGTTSLYYYLSEHPEIAPADNKEPHFFSYESNFAKGMEWYHSLWNLQDEHKIALEASTTYAMSPKYNDVPERIAQIKNAHFRFIFVMRNPVARIKSHMHHLLAGGYQQKAEVIEEYLAFSEYARQLDEYKRVFGIESLHLLLLEDLQQNPQQELRKICQFLDIDPDYQFHRISTIRNSKDTLYLNLTLRKIYEIPAVKLVGSLFKPEFRQNFAKILSRKNVQQIELSEIEKKKIINRLQPDLNRLRTEYKVDVLGKWGLEIN